MKIKKTKSCSISHIVIWKMQDKSWNAIFFSISVLLEEIWGDFIIHHLDTKVSRSFDQPKEYMNVVSDFPWLFIGLCDK